MRLGSFWVCGGVGGARNGTNNGRQDRGQEGDVRSQPPISFYLFIYFWQRWVFAAAWAFSSCHDQGLLFLAVRGLLIAVASLVAQPRL